MAGTDLYSDPQFHVKQVANLGRISHNQAAGIITAWRPFLKAKVLAVCADVVVVGTGSDGFNVYKNNSSIGQVLTTNSAAIYRATFVPSGTNAIYDTTDTLELRNLLSDTQHITNVHIVYQNQY